MEVIKPTNSKDFTTRLNKNGGITVFLAGSIEQGIAEEWQDRFVKEFEHLEITFLNPRRDNWDKSWSQSPDNPEFNYQVCWELSGLEISDYIVMYIDPKTTSPITLLEYGLCAKENKLFLCCPEGFYRRGNMQITSKFYSIPFYDTYKEFVDHMKVIFEERLSKNI